MTIGPSKRSKKRSATKRRETFFVDRSLGRVIVPQLLRAAGLKVVTHAGRFKDTTADDVWLRDVGKRKWIVLTKDQNIRKRPLEREAIIEAKVRAFVFTGGDFSGVGMGEILVAAIPKIARVIDEFRPPFVARITGAGDVAVIDDLKRDRDKK